MKLRLVGSGGVALELGVPGCATGPVNQRIPLAAGNEYVLKTLNVLVRTTLSAYRMVH